MDPAQGRGRSGDDGADLPYNENSFTMPTEEEEKMNLEDRIKRLEKWVATPEPEERIAVRAAIRRDLAAEEASTLDEAASLRAKIERLRGELRGADDEIKHQVSERDAAIARAEKAERDLSVARGQAEALAKWRCDVTVALGRPHGAFYDDVPNLIREMASEHDSFRYQLTARDATIAEARKRISGIASWLRDNGHNWPLLVLRVGGAR